MNAHGLLLELTDYFGSGGVVMPPLAGISIWVWTLILLKGWQLAGWRRREQPLGEAAALFGSSREKCATNGWQGELAGEYLDQRTGDPDLDKKLLQRLAQVFGRQAERSVTTIMVFAGLAPLLGLLGTVMGMIGVFDALAVQGTGNPRALSGGISEALVSTQTGLLVAIPALFAGHFLRRRTQNLKDRVDRFCSALSRETIAGEPS